MRRSLIAAVIAGCVAGVSHASVLVDTGLTPRVALHSAFDEYFTCDADGNCEQDYERLTRQASRFHIAAAGVGASVTLSVDHDPFYQDTYAIYRDDGGRLVPDAAHLLWYSGFTPTPTASAPLPAEYDYQFRPAVRATFSLPNIAFSTGDYWIDLIVTGPTDGDEPVLFAGTSSGVSAEQAYFDNEPGPHPFVNFAGPQASIRIDGMFAATSGTPEPTSWMFMLVGFSLSGVAVRRRRLTANTA